MKITTNKNNKQTRLRTRRPWGVHLGAWCLLVAGLMVVLAGWAQTQHGKASFYSLRATGARTANGERLHHDSLTCAHRTYPFGTLLRVTNLSNGKNVVVRVNDRGPYVKGRIIDLSRSAAKAIGMMAQGIAAVTVERLRETSIPFKPDEQLELPELDFEIADIAIGITPIWQSEPDINHQEVHHSISQMDTSHASLTTAPADTAKSRKERKSQKGSELDDIGKKPNTSKAYMKRQGRQE